MTWLDKQLLRSQEWARRPTEPQPAHCRTRLPHLHISCNFTGASLTSFCITTVNQKSDSSADERCLTDSDFKIIYPESFTYLSEKPVPFVRSPHMRLTTDELFFTQIKWITFSTLSEDPFLPFYSIRMCWLKDYIISSLSKRTLASTAPHSCSQQKQSVK